MNLIQSKRVKTSGNQFPFADDETNKQKKNEAKNDIEVAQPHVIVTSTLINTDIPKIMFKIGKMVDSGMDLCDICVSGWE